MERALRQALADAARLLYERGHNAPLDGNLSARLRETHVLTTPSGVHKGRLSADDIVCVRRADGAPREPRQRPSTELRMHLAIYDVRRDVAAIAHAHSPATVGLTVAGVSLADVYVPETVFALGTIETVPYCSPTTEDVARAVGPVAARTNAFVLERHGPVALGRSVDEAVMRLETIEHTAKILLAALSAGSPTPLDPTDVAKLRALVP